MKITLLIVVILATAATRLVTAQPPHALDPLPNPLYSVDVDSPTLQGALAAADVLNKPGPLALIESENLGLADSLDDLDGLSRSRFDMLEDASFAILFSVDRASVGSADPDAALVALNRPFNVRNQATLGQAAADLFVTTKIFTFAGSTTTNGNNTSVINQGDTGGVDYDLLPERAPSQDATEDDEDDTDAIFLEASGDPQAGVYFSSSRESPSLDELPGSASGANVYHDPNPASAGSETVYVDAAELGLATGQTGDDIDGLIIVDDGDAAFDANVDYVLFTLTRNSPSLGTEYSPADIFISTGGEAFTVWIKAGDLGLAEDDHIDGLEILLVQDEGEGLTETQPMPGSIHPQIIGHALLRVLPGDYDANGALDIIDASHFRSCYSGDAVSFDDNGPQTHFISVGADGAFSPAAITIETGDAVTWTWAEGAHTVTSGMQSPDGAFQSGAAGDGFTVEFNAALLNRCPRGNSLYPYHADNGMTGSVTVVAHACSTYDLDYDGDVDAIDAREFRRFYAQLNHGALPAMLDAEDFISALLDASANPADSALADMNDDGAADGQDIEDFVAACLANS
ncbi:MAG TPA: hypothetical protein VNT79_04980 [Phycisphaerae bacterium]|nr:hypothetical protein [Phycisphaerae bacterium]